MGTHWVNEDSKDREDRAQVSRDSDTDIGSHVVRVGGWS